jgi:CHASE1-domain containing sensor protein
MHPVIQSRARFLLTSGALILALALSLAIFAAVRRLEDQNARAAFRAAADERFDDLEVQAGLTLDKISALGGLFDASHQVERGEFERFTARLLDHDSALQALAWVPRVSNHLRLAYETAAREEGLRSFQIADRLSGGEMVRAGERSEYFPVFFVEPLRGNQTVPGFDEASDPARREALQRSADSGRMTATSPIAVIQETGNQFGFLVFRPCYQGGADPSNEADRRRALVGFVLGAIRMKDIVESKKAQRLHGLRHWFGDVRP